MADIFRSTSRKKNKLRLAAALLATAVLFFVMFSAFLIVHEADHDCGGEDCPVCMLIQLCEANIRQLGSGVPVSAAGVLFLLTLTMSVFTAFFVRIPTLVSRKIRLNN